FVNGSLTMTATPLVVAATSITRSYGVTNPPLTFTYIGFVNGQGTNVLSGRPGTLTNSAKQATSVGVYTITNTPGTYANSNYSISYANGTLTITQVVLTVKANNATRNYGATNPVFTVTYTNFVLGQGTNMLTGAPSVTTPATTNSAGGSYPIMVTNGTLSAVNY